MGEEFVVDSPVSETLVPPRQRISGVYVVYVLLGLALFGVLVEGVFIYQLYQRMSAPQPSEEIIQPVRQMGENKTWDDADSNEFSPKTDRENKTAVFLHLLHPLGVIQWTDVGFPAFSRGFNYSNGSLIIHTEGFYFLFSKVSFNCTTFKHEVILKSARYSNKPIFLMVDNRHVSVNQMKPHEKILFSSYLGGVWQLHKKEEVFVSVDPSCLANGPNENFFGGFMI